MNTPKGSNLAERQWRQRKPRTNGPAAAQVSAGPRVNKPLRLPPALVARCEKLATASGHSFNAFAAAAIEGIADMIETPEGQPPREPRIVAIARFMRSWQPAKINGAEK